MIINNAKEIIELRRTKTLQEIANIFHCSSARIGQILKNPHIASARYNTGGDTPLRPEEIVEGLKTLQDKHAKRHCGNRAVFIREHKREPAYKPGDSHYNVKS